MFGFINKRFLTAPDAPPMQVSDRFFNFSCAAHLFWGRNKKGCAAAESDGCTAFHIRRKKQPYRNSARLLVLYQKKYSRRAKSLFALVLPSGSAEKIKSPLK